MCFLEMRHRSQVLGPGGSAGNVAVECAARTATPLTFKVFNMSESGAPCELKVDSDLLHVSGPATIAVPARPKGAGGPSGYYLPLRLRQRAAPTPSPAPAPDHMAWGASLVSALVRTTSLVTSDQRRPKFT